VGEKKPFVIDAANPAVAPPPPPPVVETTDRRSLRPYAYVAGGVAAVGLLTFAIAGIASDVTYGNLSSACGKGPCPPSKASEVSAGQTEQTVADVGLGIGLAALAMGGVLFFMSRPSQEHAPAPAPVPSAQLSIAPGWLGLEGRF
jgi:hypothetical protein